MKPYVPIRPVGGNVLAAVPVTYEASGYFQPAPPAEVKRRRLAAEPFINGEVSSAELPIQTYQEWVELDWKAPHGSYKAVERIMSKLVEEAGIELVKVEEDREKQTNEEPAFRKAFEDEAGDAQWCTFAVASNGGVDATHAVRLYLRTWYLHPEPRGPITFGQLRTKLQNHSPSIVGDPYFLTDDYEPIDFIPDIRTYLAWFSLAAGNVLDRQYGYGERADHKVLGDYLKHLTKTISPGADLVLESWAAALESAHQEGFGHQEVANYILDGFFQNISKEYLGPLVGDGIVFLEYLARQNDTTLGDVAVKNMQKITDRVATHTVDKEDGPRLV